MQKQVHYINLQMDPLGDPLTARQIQTGWEICIKPCKSWWFQCLHNPDRQSVNTLVPTWTNTSHYRPEPSLTLDGPDRSNWFNYYNGNVNNTSCCTATGPKLLISPVVVDTYTCLMNTWKHYWRATNRGCISTLLLQSSVRSNRQRTRHLLWSSGWKQRVLTILFLVTIWPPKWSLRSLRSEALTKPSI
jgi:hypothetical protein